MDFYAPILLLFEMFVCVALGLNTALALHRRSIQRFILGVVFAGMAACGSFVLYLYHVYLLDEPLFFAAARGEVAIVEELLASGACPDATFEDMTTALTVARRAGHADVVKVLRRAGAFEQPKVPGLD